MYCLLDLQIRHTYVSNVRNFHLVIRLGSVHVGNLKSTEIFPFASLTESAVSRQKGQGSRSQDLREISHRRHLVSLSWPFTRSPPSHLFTFADIVKNVGEISADISPNCRPTFSDDRPITASVREVSHAHTPNASQLGMFWLACRRQKILLPTFVGDKYLRQFVVDKCEQDIAVPYACA